MITGETITPGDVIVGIESAGIHSNGLTLARHIIKQSSIKWDHPLGDSTVGESLLEPTRIYVQPVLTVLENHEVHGMVHITGGGFLNIARLASGVEYQITNLFEPQSIFKQLAQWGNVATEEMYRTFNMGMGFALICPPDQAPGVVKTLSQFFPTHEVGKVAEGDGVKVPSLDLHLGAEDDQ